MDKRDALNKRKPKGLPLMRRESSQSAPVGFKNEKLSTTVLMLLDELKDAQSLRSVGASELTYWKFPEVSPLLRELFPVLGMKVWGPLDVDEGARHTLYERFHIKEVGGEVRRCKNRDFIGLQTRVLASEAESFLEAIYVYIGFLEIIIDAYPKFLVVFSFDEILEPFLWLASLPRTSFIPFVKYITTYWFALHAKQYVFDDGMPRVPNGFPPNRSFLFNGKIRKFLKRRILSRTTRNTKFCFSILQGVKRGALIVPDSFVDVVLDKHRTTLTSGDKFNIEDPDTKWGDWEVIHGPRIEELKKKFSKVWVGFSDDSVFERKYEASTSASDTRPVKDGGQRQDIIANPCLVDTHCRVSWDSCLEVFDELPPWEEAYEQEDGSINVGLLSESGRRQRIYDNNITFDELEPQRMVLDPSGQLKWLRHYDEISPKDIIRVARGEEPTARVCPVKEPLKVRVVTCGPACLYYSVKPVQKAMHGFLRNIKQFSLIGEILSESHLYELIDLECDLERIIQQKNPDFRFNFLNFVSGDYSAATDGISSVLSREALYGIGDWIKKGNPDLWDNCVKCLSLHQLSYTMQDRTVEVDFPISDEETIKLIVPQVYSEKQRTGQLMGCPLSFPILCVINLCLYWLALEEYILQETGHPYRIKLRQLPVKVNGDDILFRCNIVLYQIWKDKLTDIFTLSSGKNYLHPHLLTINSSLYEFNVLNVRKWYSTERSSTDVYFRKLPFFNIGYLTSQSKGTMRDQNRDMPLNVLYELALEGAQDKVRAHHRFLHYNRRLVGRYSMNGRFNLFAPVSLGGLGFKNLANIPVYFTLYQRRLASLFRFKDKQSFEVGKLPEYFNYLSSGNSGNGSIDVSRNFFPLVEAPKIGPQPVFLREKALQEVVEPPPLTYPISYDWRSRALKDRSWWIAGNVLDRTEFIHPPISYDYMLRDLIRKHQFKSSKGEVAYYKGTDLKISSIIHPMSSKSIMSDRWSNIRIYEDLRVNVTGSKTTSLLNNQPEEDEVFDENDFINGPNPSWVG